jgi:hypothetical protein
MRRECNKLHRNANASVATATLCKRRVLSLQYADVPMTMTDKHDVIWPYSHFKPVVPGSVEFPQAAVLGISNRSLYNCLEPAEHTTAHRMSAYATRNCLPSCFNLNSSWMMFVVLVLAELRDDARESDSGLRASSIWLIWGCSWVVRRF